MNTTTAPGKRNLIKNKRCCCICVWITSAILGLGLLFLILGLTVFKAKRPVTKINSVGLSDLDVSLDLARLRVVLNVTLDIGVSVENPNRVGFRYTNSTAYLRYRGNDVGEVPIGAGRIGARDTRALNLTLTVMADRLLSNSDLYTDALSGTLPFQTYIRMEGKVKILFSIHVVTYTTCDLEIDVLNRTISNQKCRYRTKL
ncbi:hypothetical protein ACJIZ3_024504 [Penstemon smallii]|uniref:Late embryogenesis abundant protein LEA-2 subgroup domain-containing protein n=1 Tax=Penstemon smallii TaxID=265156 RepID=A0ABD3TV72_9LAMI